jgi:hypothetical protein
MAQTDKIGETYGPQLVVSRIHWKELMGDCAIIWLDLSAVSHDYYYYYD